MAKTQVEVITSVERRRRWSSAEKERLVAASLKPNAVVSALAREAGLHPSQLYKWRRQLCTRQVAVSGFVPVQIMDAATGVQIAGAGGRDRDRTRRRNACADHRRGRCGGRVCGGRGADGEGAAVMIAFPAGVRVWLATGHTDMRRGFDGLALLVQEQLKRDPHSGQLFVFPRPARRADQDFVARRPWHVPVRQAAGTRPLHLALCVGRCHHDHGGAARLSAGRYRLADAQHTWRPQAAG